MGPVTLQTAVIKEAMCSNCWLRKTALDSLLYIALYYAAFRMTLGQRNHENFMRTTAA